MNKLNILFDTTGIPQLADFGVSSITFHPSNNASSPYHAFSVRWSAPEILDPKRGDPGRPTKASDVYAFAMVVIEVMRCDTTTLIFSGSHHFL